MSSFAVLYKTSHKTYINKRQSGDLRAKVPYNAHFSWSFEYNTGWGTFDRLLVVQFTINEVMSS